jgi:L-serine dehydratase
MHTSIFDLFKIGIGPSSSHTVGPMRASRQCLVLLKERGVLDRVARVRVHLYGSLALTGVGHGTDRAILLGLSGEKPDQVDPERIEDIVNGIRQQKSIALLGERQIPFDELTDLLFHRDLVHPGHPNAVTFDALAATGEKIASETFFSIGGGFIQRSGDPPLSATAPLNVPHPFSNAEQLMEMAENAGLPIWSVMWENEKTLHGETAVREYVTRIWSVMCACIERGLHTEGILPGGLKVRRRAPRLYVKIQHHTGNDPMIGMDWVNAFAMAVNEENAAGGRVVTAPTNGAAGLIPAVFRYYQQFLAGDSEDGILRFFLTAGAIGILYKENASISGAEVGCQGEVGVACSMAAGGLVSALGGNNREVENAAEIGMEHHLGMTCDPIGGLVQIPCIERNAIGAVKAINACRMAMQEGGVHKVSLDQVIKTMYETGLDMQSRYKETSLAGLAVNVVEC